MIKGGVLDGKALSAAEITKLADLESREVLLAKLAGAMNASLSKAVYLFAAPLSQAARTVDALRAKVESAGPGRRRPPPRPTRPPPRPHPRPRPPTSPRVATRADPQPGRRPAHHVNATHGIPQERKDANMAKLSTDELLDAFKEMTLIELSEFVKQFEETFGVTAAAPVAVAAAGAPPPVVATPPPPRSRTSSTSSSRLPARRRSPSSRRSAR